MNVVLDAHAIIYPRAVVVESFHAFVADRTMLRPRRPHNQAVRAELNWVNQLHELLYEEKKGWLDEGSYCKIFQTNKILVDIYLPGTRLLDAA